MRFLGGGLGEGGVYQRGASNTKYTPQGGRLLDTGRLFESGRLLDHLRYFLFLPRSCEGKGKIVFNTNIRNLLSKQET